MTVLNPCYSLNSKHMITAKDYASFLQQLQWNYFITCRTPYRINTMTVRNWLTTLLLRSNNVKQAFFVTKRDKGDYNNLHAHMLIGTNIDISYQEVRYGLGNVSVGDYQPIYDSEQVCKYVTKHLGKNVDYDIVFKN